MIAGRTYHYVNVRVLKESGLYSGTGSCRVNGKKNIYTGKIVGHRIVGTDWKFITANPCQASFQHPSDFRKAKSIFRKYMNGLNQQEARKIYNTMEFEGKISLQPSISEIPDEDSDEEDEPLGIENRNYPYAIKQLKK